MSDPNLPAPEQTASEPTAELNLSEPSEFLAFDPLSAAAAPVIRGRRGVIVGAVAVVFAVILGGGAWAIWNLISGGGPQPDEALPGGTVAMISFDLDPSAGQKIEALHTLQKFPAFNKSLGLSTKADLRKFIFDQAVGKGCPGVSYQNDVAPWVGNRVAIAAVDLGGANPVPAIALAVTDRDKANADFKKIVACAKLGTDVGYVVGSDYLIASDSADHAEAILEAAKKSSLADNASYQKWTDKVGDRGVVSFYVAKKAADLVVNSIKKYGTGLANGDASAFGTAGQSASKVATTSCNTNPFTSFKDQFKNFAGLAGTVRFAGGGMEMEVAGGGIQSATTSAVAQQIEGLPANSALAFGFAVPKDYAKTVVENAKSGLCATGSDPVTELENSTGLKLPDDLTTLLGSALTLSIGGDVPTHLDQSGGFSQFPVGLVIHGDGPKIKALISTLQGSLGGTLADLGLGLKSSVDRVVITPSEAYANTLLTTGKLGNSAAFKAAIPNARRAYLVFYVNFASELRTSLIQLAKDNRASAQDLRDAERNTAPLNSFGISAWHEGGDDHFLVKLSTK
jgi:hypothetical protein